MHISPKAVCVVYIIAALVLGGVAAYIKFTLDESGYFNVTVKKQKDDLKENGQVVNVDSNLCIRKDADINSEVIYMLYEGMTFRILDKEGEWYNINYNDMEGYVNEQYVEEYDDAPPHETYEERERDIQQYGSLFKMDLEPINVELTAYCNCKICSDNWGSETAMQTQTRKGVVATPKEITLGSRLYIPDLKDYKEDGIFDVEDRGEAVKVKDDGTYIIDVWLPDHEEVKEFGRKKSVIYLIKN